MTAMSDDSTAAEPKPENSATGSATPEELTPTAGAPVPPGAVAPPDTGYTTGGVPTFDGVREKIENRYGTALGSTELAEDTAAGRTAAHEYEARHRAAAEKLEEIRSSMRDPD